jgi:RNA polymerase sigma-70 factor (ECF subfamily)
MATLVLKHDTPAPRADGAPRDEVTLALERFLTGVERRAFVTARAATGSRDEALDIVQDTMITLVRKYSGRGAAEWGPLFHTILQSRIRDWYRRNKVRRRWRLWLGRDADEDDGPDPLENIAHADAPTPEREVGAQHAVQALEQALGALPLRQQQVVTLRVWEGLDVAQTARTLGISQGAVKTHLSRAVHKLREQLGEHWS